MNSTDEVSVPSAGIVYFLPGPMAKPPATQSRVSVPSAGIVYFLPAPSSESSAAPAASAKFQSPQRGLFISYQGLPAPQRIRVTFQSPQRGLFISYPLPRRDRRGEWQVSVPSAGIVYFLLSSSKTAWNYSP